MIKNYGDLLFQSVLKKVKMLLKTMLKDHIHVREILIKLMTFPTQLEF